MYGIYNTNISGNYPQETKSLVFCEMTVRQFHSEENE